MSGENNPAHVRQLSLSFGESIQQDALTRALQWAAARLTGEESAGTISVHTYDWRQHAPDTLGAEWKKLLIGERTRGIDLEAEKAGRVVILTLPGGANHLLWTQHIQACGETAFRHNLFAFLHACAAYERSEDPASFPAPQIGIPSPAQPQGESESDTPAQALPLLDSIPSEENPEVFWTHSLRLTSEELQRLVQCCEALSLSPETIIRASFALMIARSNAASAAAFLLAQENRPETLLSQEITLDDGARISSWLQTPARESLLGQHVVRIVRATSKPDIASFLPRWMRADAEFYCAPAADWEFAALLSDKIELEIRCQGHARNTAAAECALQRWARALATLLENPDALVCDTVILSPRDEEELIEKLRGPALAADTETDIIRLLSSAHEQHGDRHAVIFEDDNLNYSDLNEYARILSGVIRQKTQSPTPKIVLCLSRTPWQPVGILGALSAHAECHIVPSGKAADLAQTLTGEKDISLVICDNATAASFEGIPQPLLALDREWDEISAAPFLPVAGTKSPHPVGISFHPEGNLKAGVRFALPHLLSHARGISDHFALADYGTLAADDSIDTPEGFTALLACLTSGAALSLSAETNELDPASIQQNVRENKAGAALVSNALFTEWQNHLNHSLQTFPESLQAILVLVRFGERPQMLAPRFTEEREIFAYALWHAFPWCAPAGVSEIDTNTNATLHFFPGTTGLILDANRHPAPAGAFAELLIGGNAICQDITGDTRASRRFDDLLAGEGKKSRYYMTGSAASFHAPGVAQMRLPEPPPPPPPPPKPEPEPEPVSEQTHAATLVAPSSSGSPLIPLQLLGSAPPIFFIHPARQGTENYSRLATEMGSSQPSYALTMDRLPLAGQAITCESLAEIDREILRAFQPDEPWRLAAVGRAGFLALHIAAGAGESCHSVCLIDPPAISHGRPLFGKLLRAFGIKQQPSVIDSLWHSCLAEAEPVSVDCELHILSTNEDVLASWEKSYPNALIHPLTADGTSPLRNPLADEVAAILRVIATS